MSTVDSHAAAPTQAPVAEATRGLLDWLARAGVSAAVGAPADPPRDTPGTSVGDPSGASSPGSGRGSVRVWPLALLADQSLRSTGQPDVLRLRIRYLITTDAPTMTTPLDRILVAAAADPSVNLVLEPIPTGLWQSFGVRPRAALQIELPLRIVRTLPVRPLVRAPLRLDDAPLVALRGRVLGPGDVPVPGVRVHAVDLGVSAHTDNRGDFVVAAVPATGATRLVVSGKGLHLDQAVPASSQPVVLRCAIEEV